jgi:rhodanese-related sulfurtransferase
MSREEFVRLVTADLPEAPAYFSRDVSINREGATELASLPDPPALSPETVANLQKEGAAVLDTRTAAEYGTAHLPGSLQIGLSGQFASWAGSLLPPEVPIVLVAEDPERAREARTRLARVGLENVVGSLDGGVAAWEKSGRPLASTEQITVDELDRRLKEGGLHVVDVRRPMEWQAGHIAEARHLPLNELPSRAGEIEKAEPLALVCAGGYRSSIATSVLEREGFRRLTNVVGGMTAWGTAGLETVSTPGGAS